MPKRVLLIFIELIVVAEGILVLILGARFVLNIAAYYGWQLLPEFIHPGEIFTKVGLFRAAMLLAGLMIGCAIGKDLRLGRPVREYLLLPLFLVAKCFVFWLHQDVVNGFDTIGHMEYTDLLRWSHISIPVLSIGYSYHPPLSFLLSRLFLDMGFIRENAAMWPAFLSSFVAFFAIRALLKRKKLLQRPLPFLFLYVTFSLPVQVFLSSSVNLDVMVMAFAALCLLCACILFQENPKRSWVPALGIGLSIAGAMYSKASGLTLFAIAPIIALLTAMSRAYPIHWAEFRKKSRYAAAGMAFACLLVAPYYVGRYYHETGQLIFLKGMPGDYPAQEDARAWRDEHTLEFFERLFGPAPVHNNSPRIRDRDFPRLADTWKDVWVRDEWAGFDTPLQSLSLKISSFYWRHMDVMLLIGLLLCIGSKKSLPDPDWRRMGLFFFAYGSLLFILFIRYIYTMPWGGALPTKFIYVAPVSWLIGYLIAHLYSLERALDDRWSRWYRGGFGFLLIGFMLMNYLVPVY
jgi:4-amino-4-deoxy-L-arabinose transferase-like glycosyltransferase